MVFGLAWFLSAVACMGFRTDARAQDDQTEPPPKPEDVVIPDGLDSVARKQHVALAARTAPWGFWGYRPSSYSSWTSHSNRLIPVYVFGDSLDPYQGENSAYRSPEALERIYGFLPTNTVNPNAEYFDQTDVYRLQRAAIESGKKRYVFLVVFDGMDWQTTWAASIYKTRRVPYTEGRGNGLLFQDYDRCPTDFGYCVTAPLGDEVPTDVDAQMDKEPAKKPGGYDWRFSGSTPWDIAPDMEYPIGRNKQSPHAYTDSSSSACSLTAGVKILNGAINIFPDRRHAETIAQWAQREKGFAVGAVTSVPIPHATPAAAYAVNVSRDDYQDISRDMLGLPSVSRRSNPYPGLDVILGAGYGEVTDSNAGQGENFIPGNRYLADVDRDQIDIKKGSPDAKYVVVERQSGELGNEVLKHAAQEAVRGGHRLLGFFGVQNGHLPFRTANGDYRPTAMMKGLETYSQADLYENPTLKEMTEAALAVLETREQGFWLMVESGDVDWANHGNNIDSSIGAVLSGEAAIASIFDWIEKKNAWDDSLVIVTADHGHYFHLVQPEALIPED
jgi:alkaline phosphatase